MKPRMAFLVAMLLTAALWSPCSRAQDRPLSTAIKQYLHYAEAETFKGVVEQLNDGKGKRDWTPNAWNRVSGPFSSGGQSLVLVGRKGSATYSFNAPDSGTYYIWVLHWVNPVYFMSFNVEVVQRDQNVATLEYATELASEKRTDPAYIYRPGHWHVWSMQKVDLQRGDTRISLTPNQKANTAVQVDTIMILGDPDLTPEFTGVPFPNKTRPKMVGNNMTRLLTPKDKEDREKIIAKKKEKDAK